MVAARGRPRAARPQLPWTSFGEARGAVRCRAAAPSTPPPPCDVLKPGGARPRAEGPWGTLIHMRQRRGGVGSGGGDASSSGSTKYTGSRVGADIRAVMVSADGRLGGGLCATRSGDGIGVG